ncbi:MAG: zinc-dependent alcohol dehydrogenase family protein [bacterium]
MRAQVLERSRVGLNDPLRLIERPLPDVGPERVRIRVSCCGVCRTDLHIAEGDLAPRRDEIIPGHQIVGVVDALGEKVTRLKVGDRVGVTWLYSACGACDCCKSGRENLCDDAHFTGYTDDGGFAEYCVVPAAFAHRLPEGIPDAQTAPLLCAGVIGYRSLRLSEIRPGRRLGLYGFGASAHVVIQLARYWGCEVYVFTRSEHHRRHAQELGAIWTGDSSDAPPKPMDSSIIFAPAGEGVHDALRCLRKGGTLAINAVHMSAIPTLPYELLYHERTIRSVANVTRRDAEEFLPLAAKIPIRTDVEIFPLAQANAALQRLKRSELRGAAVLQIGTE